MMTIEEIFSQLAAHMAKGLIVHNQIADGFGFLNLKGYQKCHEYHYFEESSNYRYLIDFYLGHYYKMIKIEPIADPQIVPQNWYKYSKMDVDAGTKKNGIRELIKKWIEWEKDTQELLQSCYKELYGINELAAAIYLQKLITEVSDELKGAQEQYINLEAMNYDLSQIIAEQQTLYEEYKKKINNIVEDDDYDQISTKKTNHSSW